MKNLTNNIINAVSGGVLCFNKCMLDKQQNNCKNELDSCMIFTSGVLGGMALNWFITRESCRNLRFAQGQLKFEKKQFIAQQKDIQQGIKDAVLSIFNDATDSD
jgi:hypothetical protein